nr:hypothetical protein GCM10017547_25570 [Pseudarthrobacter oxydans]
MGAGIRVGRRKKGPSAWCGRPLFRLLLGWDVAVFAGAGSVPGGVRPQWCGTGVRYGQRPWRLGCREGIGGRRAGMPGCAGSGWVGPGSGGNGSGSCTGGMVINFPSHAGRMCLGVNRIRLPPQADQRPRVRERPGKTGVK